MNNYKVGGKYETLDGSILINSSSSKGEVILYLRGTLSTWEHFGLGWVGCLSIEMLTNMDEFTEGGDQRPFGLFPDIHPFW